MENAAGIGKYPPLKLKLLLREAGARTGYARSAVAVMVVLIALFALQGLPAAEAHDTGDAHDPDIAHVESTTIVSTPRDGIAYRAGENIVIEQRYSEPVTFTIQLISLGTMSYRDQLARGITLGLRVGDTDREALYRDGGRAGLSPNTLTFQYTVREDDLDLDGVTVKSNGLGGTTHLESASVCTRYDSWGRGQCYEWSSAERVLTNYNGIPNAEDHRVEGSAYIQSLNMASTPADGDSYLTGERIEVDITWSAPVEVPEGADRPLTSIWLGNEGVEPRWDAMFYTSGSGSNTLRFAYTVKPDDRDDDGVLIGAIGPEDMGAGRVKVAGSDMNANHRHHGLSPGAEHKVEGSQAVSDVTVSAVEILSYPGDDHFYEAGDEIAVVVTFHGNVVVTGRPQLELDIGGAARMAEVIRLPKAVPSFTVVFVYTVAAGESDSDGISIGANKLSLNGGAIRDETGKDVVLTHDAVAADAGHRVSPLVGGL